MADTYKGLGDKIKEWVTLDKALYEYPEDLDVMYRYSNVMEYDDPNLIVLLKRILEKEYIITNPQSFDYGTIYNDIAWVYCRRGEYPKGLPYAEKAVAVNPEHDYSWETLGEIYYNLGRYSDCIDAMTKCLSCEECDYQYSALRFRGLAYKELGYDKKGKEDLRNAKKMRRSRMEWKVIRGSSGKKIWKKERASETSLGYNAPENLDR